MTNPTDYPYQNRALRDLKGEVWKEVSGLEEYYLVSNMGRVKSLTRKITAINISTFHYYTPEKVLKQTIKYRKTGIPSRLRLILTIEKQIFPIYLPDLVYSVFHAPFDNKKMVVKFKDNDPLNNRADNLYLMTRSESVKNYVRQGIMFPSKKRKRIPVEQYRLDGTYIATYTSIAEATLKTGCSHKGIRLVLKGIHTHTGGYKWKLPPINDDQLTNPLE